MDRFIEAVTIIGNIAGPFAATVAAVASLFTVLRGMRNTAKLDAAAGAIHDVHLSLNGRLGQLLDLTAKSSHAEGMLAGAALPTLPPPPEGCEFFKPKGA